MLPTIVLAVIVLALAVSARPQDAAIQIRVEQPSALSPVQNLTKSSKDVVNSSTIPPSSPPSITTSPVGSGQTLGPGALAITTSGTIFSSMPSDVVTNGTVIPSATRTSTADTVVVAGQSLSAGVPSVSGFPTTLVSTLPSVPALQPSADVGNPNSTIAPFGPPSTTTTTMLPSQILPSDVPALTLSHKTYYSNSSYVITTSQSTSMTLASSSVNGVDGVTTSAFGGVAAPTQAQGAGAGGASGGATPLDYSGAGTHRVGVWMGLVMGILGVVFGSLGAL